MATVMNAEQAERWAQGMNRADLIGVSLDMKHRTRQYAADWSIRARALFLELQRRHIRL